MNNITNLTMATRQQVIESLIRLENVKKELGIRPCMVLVHCGGSMSHSFDLRSLNQNLVAKVRKR